MCICEAIDASFDIIKGEGEEAGWDLEGNAPGAVRMYVSITLNLNMMYNYNESVKVYFLKICNNIVFSMGHDIMHLWASSNLKFLFYSIKLTKQ